ncbi:MAG: molecular chaperone DnaJ [Nocardioidaceae bacterium]
MTSTDWATKDFYKTLGVDKDASAAQIKKAYRKLARDNHPDSHPGDRDAEERFKAVAAAYDVVGDPEKRKQYDDMRTMSSAGYGPFRGSGGGTGFDINDLFGGGTGADGGGLGDILGGVFGGRARTRTAAPPRRGADLETETTIGFNDAINGVTVSLRLSSDAPCPDCNGTGARAGTMPRVCPECDGVGMVAASVGGAFTMNETCPVCHGRGLVVDEPCPTCHGSGRGLSNRTVQARIPAGVRDGAKIRLRGKGASGERGGPAGDLFVTVHVAKHRLFGRKGDNLTLTVPVAFDEAALGAEIKVPTLDGAPVTLKIPAGTPNGRTFRVRGKGAPRKDGQKADLLVTIDVQVPAVLDEKARQAIEALRAATSGGELRSRLFDGSRP